MRREEVDIIIKISLVKHPKNTVNKRRGKNGNHHYFFEKHRDNY